MPNQDDISPCQFREWFHRIRAGDRAARDQLMNRVYLQLERLTRGMLRGYSRLYQYLETGDVLNTAAMRLLRALETIHPETPARFYGLAAEEIRRELIDVTRKLFGPNGYATRHVGPLADGDSSAAGTVGAVAVTRPEDPAEAEQLTRFHVEVRSLPLAYREVIGLIYYLGVSQREAAEVLGVSPKTVRDRWAMAMVRLRPVTRGGPHCEPER